MKKNDEEYLKTKHSIKNRNLRWTELLISQDGEKIKDENLEYQSIKIKTQCWMTNARCFLF